MGTLPNNKNKRNPKPKSNHIAKKPKPSKKNSVSRLHSYPDHITPITKQIQAPCAIISGFNSTQKRFTQNMQKKSTPVEKDMFLKYFRAKETAIESCRHVKFENLEKCDDDDVEVIEVGDGNVGDSENVVEVMEVDNGNVGESGNVIEVIDLDDEESSGSGEVEEIRAKYKKLDGPSLRKLRHDVKLKEMKISVWLKLHPVKKEEEEEEGSVRNENGQTGQREYDLNPDLFFYATCLLQLANEKDVVHDLFNPLTEKEEEMVANAQSYSNREKVLANHVNSNIMITGKALQCLRPHAWLNDEVINIYLELLKDRERKEPKKYLKCHFFNTFFYKKLVGGKTRTGYDYESVKRWTAQKKLHYTLDECDKIFVPIHKEIHWCLAVINKKDKKFQYLDSLGGADKKVLRALAKYITDEVKDKTGKSIDVTSWEHEFVTNLPTQENGHDCGMFMIKYIDFYSRGIELSFSQDDMPYFRKRTAKEILMLTAN